MKVVVGFSIGFLTGLWAGLRRHKRKEKSQTMTPTVDKPALLNKVKAEVPDWAPLVSMRTTTAELLQIAKDHSLDLTGIVSSATPSPAPAPSGPPPTPHPTPPAVPAGGTTPSPTTRAVGEVIPEVTAGSSVQDAEATLARMGYCHFRRFNVKDESVPIGKVVRAEQGPNQFWASLIVSHESLFEAFKKGMRFKFRDD